MTFNSLNMMLTKKTCLTILASLSAWMVKLVDTLVSGTSARKGVEVRVLLVSGTSARKGVEVRVLFQA